MAIKNEDLLIAYRPSENKHYKINADQFSSGSSIPDGTEDGQVLVWDGSDWVAQTIDGGTY